MQTWVFSVSGHSRWKYWGIFSNEAATSLLCENCRMDNRESSSQTATKCHSFRREVCCLKRPRVLNTRTLDRSLGSTVTRCLVSLVQSSSRSRFSRALTTCNAKDSLSNSGSTRLVSLTEDGPVRTPSWLHSVLPVPALPTPDGQTLRAPPPRRLVLPQ